MTFSCDTFFTTFGDDKYLLFAKNSDRPPNESCELIFTSPNERAKQLTYTTLPNIGPTKYSTFLCKPAWMWGAEMGVNEKGLCIGNEAIFSNDGYNKQNNGSLLGMDILRLALEQCATTVEAVDFITKTISQFGQGGNCNHECISGSFYYHNSFLIVDNQEQWIIETVNKHWVTKKITSGRHSISNYMAITNDFEKSSEGLLEYAIATKICARGATLNWQACFTDKLMHQLNIGKGHDRQCRTRSLIEQYFCDIDTPVQGVKQATKILRHHLNANFHPRDGGLNHYDICAHSSYGPIRSSQTTSSMIVVLDRHTNEFFTFVTGTSNPCMSVFKPVIFGGIFPEQMNKCSPYFDNSLWWRGELLARHLITCYDSCPEIVETITSKSRKLEETILEGSLDSEGMYNAFREHYSFINESIEEINRTTKKRATNGLSLVGLVSKMLYNYHWRSMSDVVGLNDEFLLRSQSNLLEERRFGFSILMAMVTPLIPFMYYKLK